MAWFRLCLAKKVTMIFIDSFQNDILYPRTQNKRILLIFTRSCRCFNSTYFDTTRLSTMYTFYFENCVKRPCPRIAFVRSFQSNRNDYRALPLGNIVFWRENIYSTKYVVHGRVLLYRRTMYCQCLINLFKLAHYVTTCISEMNYARYIKRGKYEQLLRLVA